jgi:hypothetical protein
MAKHAQRFPATGPQTGDVCFGSEADIAEFSCDVGLVPEAAARDSIVYIVPWALAVLQPYCLAHLNPPRNRAALYRSLAWVTRIGTLWEGRRQHHPWAAGWVKGRSMIRHYSPSLLDLTQATCPNGRKNRGAQREDCRPCGTASNGSAAAERANGLLQISMSKRLKSRLLRSNRHD